MISPRSLKKELARGPSQPEPKTMSTRARISFKRKKPTEITEDAFQIEHHFHEVITEGFVRIQALQEKNLVEAEEKIADLRTIAAAKDKKIAQLEKEVNGLKKKIMVAKIMLEEIEANKVELEATGEAKVCAARTILQDRIKMAEEAKDPIFDRSAWNVEGWKLALLNFGGEADEDQVRTLEARTSEAKEQKGGVGEEAGGDVAAVGDAATMGNDGC
ncbi:hypothetical protein Hanom_Chr15g01406081 [Helianthus anomalus]